ncbi:MAG: addiction module protein [Candidatus Brocadia sp.]|nr:addiction module protein [Candidatus Brocadia sp.]
MTTPIELIHEIEKLPPRERVRIVDIVIRDVLRPDSDIDKVWAQEASSRWDAYKRGEIKSVPYEEVMSKYKK